MHGDADRGLIYTSPHLPKPLQISLADPKGDRDRNLFSHYLWNSSLLLAELIETGTLRLSGTDTGLAKSTSDDAGVDAAPALEFNIAGLATLVSANQTVELFPLPRGLESVSPPETQVKLPIKHLKADISHRNLAPALLSRPSCRFFLAPVGFS